MYKTLMRFVFLDVEQHLIRLRWLIPILAALFLTYLSASKVLITANEFNLKSNSWDVLFSVFGNGYYIFFIFNPLLLYLVSDLTIDTDFGRLVVFRLLSRRQWWAGKIITASTMVLFYLGMILVIISSISSFVLPWQNDWSELARGLPQEFWIDPQELGGDPLKSFLVTLLFLSLGWFSLVLTTVFLTRITKSAMLGFIFGTLVNISGILGVKGWLLPPWEYLFMHVHLLYNLHLFTLNQQNSYHLPAFAVSLLYWILWSGILIGLGFTKRLSADFLSSGDLP